MADKMLGPCGGVGGNTYFDESGISIPSNIKKIIGINVWSNGVYLDSIQIKYITLNGNLTMGSKRGAFNAKKKEYDFKNNEYLFRISGRCGHYVDKIVFHTRFHPPGPVKKYPPGNSYIGGNGGIHAYNLEVPVGYHITGFFGRYGGWFDSIGVIYHKI